MKKIILTFLAFFLLLFPISSYANSAPYGDFHEAYITNEDGIITEDGFLIPYGTLVWVSEAYSADGIGELTISYEGHYGLVKPKDFISKDFNMENARKVTNPQQVVLFSDAVVYSGPSPLYESIGVIKMGSKVTPTLSFGELFDYVQTEELSGWICNHPGFEFSGGGYITPADNNVHFFEDGAELTPWNFEGNDIIANTNDEAKLIGISYGWNMDEIYKLFDINGMIYSLKDSYFFPKAGSPPSDYQGKIKVIYPNLVEAYESPKLENKLPLTCENNAEFQVIEVFSSNSYSDEDEYIDIVHISFDNQDYYIDLIENNSFVELVSDEEINDDEIPADEEESDSDTDSFSSSESSRSVSSDSGIEETANSVDKEAQTSTEVQNQEERRSDPLTCKSINKTLYILAVIIGSLCLLAICGILVLKKKRK